MNTKISAPFQQLRRDALAGTVTGAMAVPLSIGICLLSDYPVMTGLYTVIFACIVSFTTYLFRPGNYTGVPGIAAGLAPALALGVSTFGYENMPFVILITALFQALVWKFKWERFILRIVPHYLVEGLLAGVGLKIALKFVPFLYDIEHETDTWLNYEREIILLLSIVSFVLFVMLFKYYKKKMPALPYLIIMGTSFALSFFMPLPRVSINAIPFHLQLPLPVFTGLDSQETFTTLAKMIGFAIMLGTIDVIEQVMSNVAIEKMAPYKRKTNTNNSLLSMWISNLGATFFGGMTSLDGLAKSTTNTVAGAVTKTSNLFTAVVVLMFVLFPAILDHLPEYALGIIMVYSGWKMIANIAHVRSEGRYALIMASVCGLLVFELGIFEGLILLLAVHSIIQFIFMKRIGKTNAEILAQFTDSFKSENNQSVLEKEDQQRDTLVPVLTKWTAAINDHDIDGLLRLYSDNAIMIPAFSTRIRASKDEIRELYANLFKKDSLEVEIQQITSQSVNGLKIDSGQYLLKWSTQGFSQSNHLRFSFVIQEGKIATHHSSIEPSVELTVSKPEAYADDYVG